MPINVSIKIIPMYSELEFSSSVSFSSEESFKSVQEKKFVLTNQGDYSDISLFPHYIKDIGVKKPACRIVLSLDGQTVKQWVVTVYNPRYGSRLKRDTTNNSLFFSYSSTSWATLKNTLPKPILGCRVVIHQTLPEVDSKVFDVPIEWEHINLDCDPLFFM